MSSVSKFSNQVALEDTSSVGLRRKRPVKSRSGSGELAFKLSFGGKVIHHDLEPKIRFE